MHTLSLLLLLLLVGPVAAQLKPAVAVEAEDFTISKGWKVVKNGAGNYMVDIIGFCHLSGERLLSLPSSAKEAGAHKDIVIPVAGDYRLWARYEYPAFCETRFRVRVEQGGKVLLNHVMGKKNSPRYGFGDPIPKAQHDPSWGPEGLFEEAVTVRGLAKGPARLFLEGVDQPQKPGVSADRNIDCLYLSSDVADAWRPSMAKRVNLYPFLEAFRDSLGARWEVRFTNKGTKPANVAIRHVYNRLPWGVNEAASVPALKPDATSDWIGLLSQDTTHFSMIEFVARGSELIVEIRPVGSAKVVKRFTGTDLVRVYVPPYPGKGDEPTTPEEAIDRILAALKKSKAPGKVPTKPLCYGGWLPLGREDAYGRKYAQLYAALGFRSLHPANSGTRILENLKEVGIEPTKSWMVMGYRNPPTRSNIDRAKVSLNGRKLTEYLRFFDYGDEIAFSEWMSMFLTEEVAAAKVRGDAITQERALRAHWQTWLKKNRSDAKFEDYWMPSWGPIAPMAARPDSSAKAAIEKPRLYVDSLLFYEETAIAFAAKGMKDVKATLGNDVLCGANYSCHPFYYPSSTMYIKWFRGGAADMGRHSEYFWQVAQLGPMINGYVAEHFRAGLRDNPKGVLRQYTMPHSPGNSDGSFIRTACTHLAHGATMLDFFGVGMNETFTENHIDHRAVSRFKSLRDVTHLVGFVEDLLPDSKPVASGAAILVSESTERWDFAGVARDRAGHDHFGKDFRKTRMHFHLERLGIWKALTFAGYTPDIVTEQDVIEGKLKDVKILYVVGDHWPQKMIAALEKFVGAGGHVFATAGSGARTEYGERMRLWHAFVGLNGVTTEQKTTFLRPRQEMPFLDKLGDILIGDLKMPVLATSEAIIPGPAMKVLYRFADKKPAVAERIELKGRIVYVAAHPGLAYMWSAVQPPSVPDRGPGTHSIPTNWDKAASKLIVDAAESVLGEPILQTTPTLIDARLLKAKKGYIIPLASYTGKTGEKVELQVRMNDAIKKVSSAYQGELKFEECKGKVTITIPSLTYGDVIRIE